ncbi:MAG: phosphate signaling complex protein PhoU [Proteobacteria bacterium]|nr:phosphate signaling complex protein PhoU [Pseudomonadota bacterium]MBU1418628.1 phosphate signaling complex protein PhoU [Pseudomonadota bacterium]MBU1455821.1 phosphate signaling complex protein PhoU [Pseudomonadota bacterium]
MAHQLTFHREIDKLKKKFMVLGSMVEDRLQKASLAMQTRDPDLLQEIVSSDWEIDDMEVEVEEECLKILALHQPVASDLRLLVAIIKINNELERIADNAVNIAKRLQTISKDSTLTFRIDYQPMSGKVLNMFKLGLDALVTEDADLARKIFHEDEEVDSLRNQAYRDVIRELDSDPGHAACLVNLYLLARHLERIGDRITNIAEEVIYLVEGKIVRGEID